MEFSWALFRYFGHVSPQESQWDSYGDAAMSIQPYSVDTAYINGWSFPIAVEHHFSKQQQVDQQKHSSINLCLHRGLSQDSYDAQGYGFHTPLSSAAMLA